MKEYNITGKDVRAGLEDCWNAVYDDCDPRDKLQELANDLENADILVWHKWKDRKPRKKRWVLFWWGKDKNFAKYSNVDFAFYSEFPGLSPTLWAYLPSQRDMVACKEQAPGVASSDEESSMVEK